jgi:endonuclease/exonuclease/phosphatase family metal-dependent hydrolase
VTVASVHLSLLPEERRAHARAVVSALRGLGPAPYVVAGDLNEPPDGPAWGEFGELVGDAAPTGAPTFPARSPRQRIDAVLVSAGVEIEAVRVPGPDDQVDPVDLALASDHLPVVADLLVVPVGA